jgi:hypothetical protein
VLLDYCHYADPICAVGSEPQDVNEHLNYFLLHNPDVVKWVAGMAKASSDGDVSAKPSKPVIASSSSSHDAQPTSSSSVAAKPAKTGLPTSLSPLNSEPSVTDVEAAAQQTGTSTTGAAGSLTVTLGYLTVLAAAVVVSL